MFSAEADVVAGLAVTAIGVDALRQVHRAEERALGLLPVLLGAHLLVEAVVWEGLTGGMDASAGRAAMWIYLAFALVVLPVLVPFAIHAVEQDDRRRRAMARLGVAGASLAGVYLLGLLNAPVEVRIEGRHLAYLLHMDHGGLLAGIYAVVVCAPPMLSANGRSPGSERPTWSPPSPWCGWRAAHSRRSGQ